MIENLKSEKSVSFIRETAYLELLVRYGADFAFEIDMFVYKQKQAIALYEEWLEDNRSKFEAGKFYFAGKEI